MAKNLILKYAANGGKSRAQTYSVPGYTGLSVTLRSTTDKKTAGSAQLHNVVNEIVINAEVPVASCDTTKCSTEIISARIRVSGSSKNSNKVQAVMALLKKLNFDASAFEGFVPTNPAIASVDIETDLAVVYPPK